MKTWRTLPELRLALFVVSGNLPIRSHVMTYQNKAIRADGNPPGAEGRIKDLGIELPVPPTPFGSYVEALQTGNLLYLSGMLPVVDHKPAYVGTLGIELDANAGRSAARTAALGALAAAKHHLGTLERIKRVVRLGVFMVTAGSAVDQPGVADGASDLLRDIFGDASLPVRSVIGVASLPLGVPVEVEIIFELNS
jgi:enamine deaminase RidA (YjgF/YER057c/UK114 family)